MNKVRDPTCYKSVNETNLGCRSAHRTFLGPRFSHSGGLLQSRNVSVCVCKNREGAVPTGT